MRVSFQKGLGDPGRTQQHIVMMTQQHGATGRCSPAQLSPAQPSSRSLSPRSRTRAETPRQLLCYLQSGCSTAASGRPTGGLHQSAGKLGAALRLCVSVCEAASSPQNNKSQHVEGMCLSVTVMSNNQSQVLCFVRSIAGKWT